MALISNIAQTTTACCSRSLYGCISLGEPFPDRVMYKLAAATQWLLKLVDPESGGVPNLGPNDGANILPLSTCPFSDYRPTLQAASLIFLDLPAFAPGPWDDMSLWLNRNQSTFPSNPTVSPGEIKIALPLSLSNQTPLSPYHPLPGSLFLGIPARCPIHQPSRTRRSITPGFVVAGDEYCHGSRDLFL